MDEGCGTVWTRAAEARAALAVLCRPGECSLQCGLRVQLLGESVGVCMDRSWPSVPHFASISQLSGGAPITESLYPQEPVEGHRPFDVPRGTATHRGSLSHCSTIVR